MDIPTHYELLCVTPEATADEIRNAYRRLIRLYHPDVSGAAGEGMTLRLNDAKRDLLDPTLRAQYDRLHVHTATGARSSGKGAPGSGTGGSRVHDEWRSPIRPEATKRAPANGSKVQYGTWMFVALASIGTIMTITVIVFTWAYSGQLGLTTPRVVPPLVIAVAWLVGGLSRPSRLFVGLLVVGSMLWPLAAFGVAPFTLLSDTVPPVILAALSVLGIAVLALRISAPLACRLSRVGTASI